MFGDGLMGERIEHPALRVDGGSLNLWRVWPATKNTATRGLSDGAKVAEVPVTAMGLAVAGM